MNHISNHSGMGEKGHPLRVSWTHFGVEAASALTSVAAYQPFRTASTYLANGEKLRWKFNFFYKGFFASALGAHQLFLMAEFERRLRGYYSQYDENPSIMMRVALGSFAGVLTAPTVTPCDMWMMAKQLNHPKSKNLSSHFRGIIPIACRQIGLGSGMYVLPAIVSEKLKMAFPERANKNERLFKIGSAFLSGCSTAAATQIFEVARILMQSDPEGKKHITTWSALKAAPRQMITQRGYKIFCTRLSVIAVATVVMFNAREFYLNAFFKEKT